MLHFLQQNLASIIIIIVLILCVALAIAKIVRDRRKGIGPCGQNCDGCSNQSCARRRQ